MTGLPFVPTAIDEYWPTVPVESSVVTVALEHVRSAQAATSRSLWLASR